MSRSTNHNEVRLIAHRGWSTRFTENSLPALAAAIAAGTDEVEFDVRVSSDGVPFLCHDETVDRVSNLSGPCDSHEISMLERASLFMPDGGILEGLGFSRLDKVMSVFGEHVDMNIHVKVLDPHLTTLEYVGRYTLTHRMRRHYVAGDEEVLAAARRVCPHVPRCLIQDPGSTCDTLLETAVRLGCERVQFFKGHYRVEDVRSALQRGLVPNLFWADTRGEVEEAIQAGIIGILTNDIGPVKSFLRGESKGPRVAPQWAGRAEAP